jgi:hypothetical protein
LGHHHNEALSNAFLLAFRHLPKMPVPFVDLAISAVRENGGLVFAMGPLARMQEFEADALGLLLASRAGYQISELVGFYRKLAAQDDTDGASGTASHRRRGTAALRKRYEATHRRRRVRTLIAGRRVWCPPNPVVMARILVGSIPCGHINRSSRSCVRFANAATNALIRAQISIEGRGDRCAVRGADPRATRDTQIGQGFPAAQTCAASRNSSST